MEEDQTNIKIFKYLPIPIALLGIIYCGFVLLFEVGSDKEKLELTLFFLGAFITLLGILTIYGMGMVYKKIASPKEEKEEKPVDEVEGL